MAIKLKKKTGALDHDDLVELGRRWLLRPLCVSGDDRCRSRQACPLVITEITSSVSETPDVIGWHGKSSTVVEAKASRGDFLADAKKHFRRHPELGMGSFRYFIAPEGLIAVSELPPGWGLIEVDVNRRLRVKYESGIFTCSKPDEILVLLSLIRRFKIDPGKHVSIRAYTLESQKDPRATVTI